ncbi:hypothetical protein cypCar_00028928 [Cyprinus carpio]|nr:hypothetical protein cypCar_00028928 [Cyprinus carpio]
MRELVILAALVSALHAASLLTGTDVVYKCQKDQDKIATLEAESFINDHHRHGYKFKFVSQDSRSAEKKTDPCEVVLGITLEETECHIVNPKPLDQCETRKETQTRYGFCKSTKVGIEEPEVECEIYEAKDIVQDMVPLIAQDMVPLIAQDMKAMTTRTKHQI